MDALRPMSDPAIFGQSTNRDEARAAAILRNRCGRSGSKGQADGHLPLNRVDSAERVIRAMLSLIAMGEIKNDDMDLLDEGLGGLRFGNSVPSWPMWYGRYTQAVTVCIGSIATIGGDQCVIGVTDRMRTSGDIEYEPPHRKIYQLTNAAAILTAGDSALQDELCRLTFADVAERIELDPGVWIPISDIAEIYSRHYADYRAKAAERALLVPLGLSATDFGYNETFLASQLAATLSRQMADYSLRGTEAVILGMDESGPHIWQAFRGEMTLRDGIGFAVVGSGAWHASSQLMNSGYTRYLDFVEATIITALAKQRAEVAPGVGKATDIVVIGPLLGNYFNLEPDLVDRVASITTEVLRREVGALNWGVGELRSYYDEQIKRAQASTVESGQNAGGEDESQ